MTTGNRFLMCPPDHYDVDYVINPWMEGNIHKLSRERAAEQWKTLHQVIRSGGSVDLLPPHEGVPDMVFTANAGLVLGRTVVLSRFYHEERQREEPHFKKWFEENGFTVHELPADVPFEGAGDALFDRAQPLLWAGYGFRTELDAHSYIAEWLSVEVVSLHLVDERFYHLDTCFCPLEDGYVLYFPPAFDRYSNHLIESRLPEERRIAVDEVDALAFACNAVNIGRKVIMNRASDSLKARLGAKGFAVFESPLSEFMKAGGAAKCLTLRLNEDIRREQAPTPPAVETRVIRLQGHLLDSGLIGSVLDAIIDGGGSFQVMQFQLGEQRQSLSIAEIKVIAQSGEVMEKLLSQLLRLGAQLQGEKESEAQLAEVTKDGVAPDDFYVTTIFPTEVCIGSEWIRLDNQRMDAAVVVRAAEASSAAQVTATCCLLRDLRVGDKVVVGVEGIRNVRKAKSYDSPTQRAVQEFTFMGSGVSSERRVELLVEQIAWDLRQIRDRGGKAIVTAGPVVIHTGGGEHLSKLIRDGYVQALLGGNAIAVHDIEQALMGTSLGVDLQRGVPVPGGHRHHLKVINLIRKHGSIAQAVDAGVVTKGIFYECVKHEVPFSLAGSIRDDGPLPDTEMDLLKAQAAYASLIQDADMILLLSSMLHSIGVANMTPAGVKLVCVDINPAVVTKLIDRGSLHSTGIVTDVGLFLSLLVQQLDRLTKPPKAA
ncbi:MAG: TIGR00300 family protein [Bdellovibrionales bacterium]|nr:TIGR00300 family protein [Bdellovibrionales bacterium]